MASAVQICNVALSKIGESPILSLTEDSRSGRVCNLVYVDLRQAILGAHPWNFAIKRVELSALTTAPAFGFSYQHQLPSDFLKALQFYPEGTDIAYRVEGKRVLSNEPSVKLRYVSDVTDANEYSPLFREVLSARLASEIAIFLFNDRTLSDQMFTLYQDKLIEARSMDAMDGTPENIEATSWLEARY